MDKLRVAVVGLGRIGWQFHFKEAVASARFDLTAVVDPLADRVEEAVADSGCNGYATYEAMLESEKPDLIALATPTTLHEQQTLQAIDHGCHVILEKPMTTSVESADRMIEAAAAKSKRIFIYQPHRLTPETATVKTIIASGKLGKIYSIKRGVFRFVRRNDWQSLKKNGGGMLNNYGAHYIDQLLYLADHPDLNDIRCRLWAAVTLGDADDVVRVWMTTTENVLLDLEINQASAQTLPAWHICGDRGTLISDSDGFHVKYYRDEDAPPLEIKEGAAPGRSYDNLDRLPWIEEQAKIEGNTLDFYANIHDVLTGTAEPYIPIEQTRELMRVMAECRQDASTD